MSNLRILGILVGLAGLFVTMARHRGAQWRRGVFFAQFFTCVVIVAISINPDLVDFARDMLLLEEHAQGRIMALLILGVGASWFFMVHLYGKVANLKHQNDLLVRAVSAEHYRHEGFDIDAKPIMVLIPAYNEAENLAMLLPKMPRDILGHEVGALVIDDGSSDETCQVVRDAGFNCIRNIINRGQGAASRLGYDVLRAKGIAYGVTMDADNQHRPEDIENLLAPLVAGEADLVVGSRILGSADNASRLRYTGVVLFSRLISLVTGLKVSDCSNGFKAFNRKWLETVVLQEDQFQSTEVIIQTVKKGLRVSEAPVTVDSRLHGTSKKGTDFRYGIGFAKTIVKTVLRK